MARWVVTSQPALHSLPESADHTKAFLPLVLPVRTLWVPEEISPWKYVCSKLVADWMLPGVNYMSTLTLAQGSILTRLMKAIIEEGIPHLVHYDS